ncbi:LOW QUALITY PROTEIN: Retrotransposon Polyprotein [Phytophthora megakarya]|uniref:Retrotransposon Polyprotein n=1 Tax=Phytophthora megakarya TaxID=4795 RepID=A0A225UF71_9STRA|nr:LOW QUALITY PROTEIN: Retrotransposon Polyprotein [Phytophthora megakarya]
MGLPDADGREGGEMICSSRGVLQKLYQWIWVPNGPAYETATQKHQEWMTAQETAFTQVKQILTTRPLLAYPNFSRPFDWKRTRDDGNGRRPVAYASKVNSQTEANYGITELECAAVVWAIKLFHPYLYGRRFSIVTDHAALKWLMTSPNLTANYTDGR